MTLYGSFENYKKSVGNSNTVTGGYQEWKKKKKKPKWVDPVKVAQQRRLEEEQRRKAEEPPVAKPVDQIEHENLFSATMKGLPEASKTVSNAIENTLIEKPANYLLNKENFKTNAQEELQTPLISGGKKVLGGISNIISEYGKSVPAEQSSMGEEMVKKLSLMTKSITGATGGAIDFEKTNEIRGNKSDWLDKTIDILSQGVGMASTLGLGEGALNAVGGKIPLVTNIAKKYPKFAKIAGPLAKDAISFAGYGQLDPKLADDYNTRLKKAGVDAVMSVPYTLLGFIKDFRKSVPTSFMLGFGMAKLDGADNKDALVAGSALGLLDLYGRKGGASDKYLFTGKKVSNSNNPVNDMFRENAVANINEFSDIKINSHSSKEEIDKAYKSAARKTHPDLGGNEKDFKKVKVARDFLTGRTEEVQNYQEEQERPETTEQPSPEPQEQTPVKEEITPTQEKTKEEPNNKVLDILETLGEENKNKITDKLKKLSDEEINKVINVLDKASEQANDEQKKVITKHRKILENEVNGREAEVEIATGKVIFENKIDELDNLSDKQREKTVDTIKKISETEDKTSAKAKKITEVINKNNTVIKEELQKADKVKKQLLKEKSEAEEPVRKKEIQEKIDKLDDKRIELKKSKNKFNFNKLKKDYGKNNNNSKREAGSRKLPSSLQVGKNKPTGTGEHTTSNERKGKLTSSNINDKSGKRYADRQYIEKEKEVKPKVEKKEVKPEDSLTEEAKKYENSDELYDKIQKQIDDEIDKELEKGLSFQEANNTSTVKKLYEARFKVEDIDVQKLRKELFDKLPTDNKTKKFIIEKQFQLREKGTLLMISNDNIQEFINNEEATKKTLLLHILRDRNIDENIFNPRISGLGQEAREKLAKKFGDEVNGIYDSVKNVISNLKSTKITKSQLKEIWDEAKKKEKKQSKKYTKEEIEKLVKSKDTFTEEEKNILRQYEGAGGDKNATGRGILDEYYTPQKIVDSIWRLIGNNYQVGDTDRILEPSVGTGRFLKSAPKNAKIAGLETNPISAKIAQVLYPNAKIINQPFEEIFIDKKGHKKKFQHDANIVLGNPPYGIHRGRYKGLGEEPKIGTYEDYFLKRSLDLTSEGGIVAMVVPSGFIRRKIGYSKKVISELGELVDAYRLPNGSFGRTDVGTDIVIFRRTKEPSFSEKALRAETISNNGFFRDNPQKVLGIEKERRGQFGMEKYIEGNLDDAIDKINAENKVIEEQAEEEFDNEDVQKVEMEQPVTPEVKKEAIKKTVVAKRKRTKRQKTRKDIEVKGVFKREAKTPHIVVSTKKEKVKTFYQGEKLSPEEQKLYDLTREDGTIGGTNLTDKEKKELNIIPSKSLEDKYMTDFNYYQGDAYEKLEKLEENKREEIIDDEHYNRQKRKLKEMKPEEMKINQITLLPIDNLAKEIEVGDKKLIDSFIEWLRELPRQAMEGSSRWEIAGYLNGQPVRGGDKKENAVIKVRRRKIGNKLFKKFYTEELDEKYQQKIVDKFNKSFNGYIKPDYTKYPLQISLFKKFYGKPFEVRPIQMEGSAFLVNKGVGLLAYEVGVGKTLTAISAISEVMRKGWAKKPLIIVPKNLKSKWIRDIAESMPNIKINDLSNLGGDFKYKGNKEDLKIEDGTLSIITEEGFKRIGFSDETYKRLTDGLQDVIYEKNKKTKRAKEISKAKTEEIVGLGMKKTDYPLTFEQLGFDHITMDEAHRSKNIFSKAKAKSAKGQSSNEYGAVKGSMSERGLKTYLATQYILEKNNGRNVFLLTATPFNNSPIEIYSILSLMAKKRLEGLGIKNINDFISLFVDLETRYAVKANGKIELTDQVRNFNNLRQLQEIVREYIDFRTGEEANIPRPEKKKNTPFLKMNEIQSKCIEKAQELFSPEYAKEGGTLKAIGEMQKITLSPYLSNYSNQSIVSVSPKDLVENSPKIKYTVEAIKKVHKTNPNAGQIIFAEKGIEIFRPLREYFIKELGYKEDDVEIIDSKCSNEVKDNIKDRFQNGETKILIASGTVKEGIDLQRTSTDLYNLYLQWNPTDMIQVEGRTWRQGSYYDKVRIHYPLVENSVDPFIFQKLEEKASRVANVFNYKGDTLDVSDIDFEGMKFDLITNPVMKVKAKYDYDKTEIDDEMTVLNAEIAFLERRSKNIEDLKETIEQLEENKKNSMKKEDDQSVKYYSDRLTKTNEKLKEEQDKIAKKGIDIKKTTQEATEKRKKLEALEKKETKLREDYEKNLEKAEEEKYEVISGENNYKEIVSHLGDKEFFTHESKISVGKLPKEMLDISDDNIDNIIKREDVKKAIEKTKKDINPFIAKQAVVNIVKELTDNINGVDFHYAGSFNKYFKRISISQSQGVDTMEEAIAHEPGHLAWMYLTDIERASVKNYIDSMSLKEKRLLMGKTTTGDWKYDSYIRNYGNDDWRMAEEIAVTISAKEYIKNKGKYSKNKFIAFIQKFIDAFIKLMNRVQSKIFGKNKKELFGMDIMREIYDSRSTFFDSREYREDDIRKLSNYLVDFGAKPQLEVQSIPLSKINLDDEVFVASEDYRKGRTSKSLLPILVEKKSDGTFDIIDGRHRLVEQVEEGKKDFLAVTDEKVYRIYAEEEESLRGAGKINVKAHTRAGVDVKAYARKSRMGMVLEENKVKTEPLINEKGKISVFNLYKKVYTGFYNKKPPVMTTLEDKKLTTSMTKRAFTLGKRFSAKEIKDNYKEVQREIRNYIVKNIPPKNRGELLRSVINAKSKADVDIVMKKVDRMVEIAKGRKMAEEKRKLITSIKRTLVDRGMTIKNSKEINGAMLKQLVTHVSGDKKRKAMKQLTMEELEKLKNIAKTLKKDKYGRIILFSNEKLDKLDDVLPENLRGKEFVTMGDIEESLANKDITGGWFGITDKNTFRASRLVMIKNEVTKKMYDKFTTADRHFADEFEDFQKEVGEMYKEASGKRTKFRNEKTDKNIIDYLENRKSREDLTEKELKLADFTIKFYADSIEVMKPNRLKKYYFTHTRENFMEAVRRAGFGEAVKEFFTEEFMTDLYDSLPPEIASSLEHITSNNVFNPFGQPRKGNKFSYDFRKSLQAYSNVYFSKKHFDKLYSQANAVKTILPKNMRMFFERMVQSAKGRPDKINWHPLAKKTVNAAVTFEYIKLLGANLSSGLFNILIGTVDSFANYGLLTEDSLLKGHARYITPQGFRMIKKYRVADQNITYEMTKIMDTIPEVANKFLFFHLGLGEHYLRGTGFLSSLTKEEYRTGKVSDERMSEIRHKMGEAQPLYGGFDSPIYGRTTIGKTMFMFMTWLPTRIENWMNWMIGATRTIKNEKGFKDKVVKNEDLGKLIRYASIFFLFSLLFSDSRRWEAQVEEYKDLFSIKYWIELANPTKKPVWKDVINVGAMFHYLKSQERYRKRGYDYSKGDKKWQVYLKRILEPTAVRRIERGENIVTAGWIDKK